MRRLVVVLGMHRSGTSATAGTLAELGVELGPTASSSNVHNPRGNREMPRLRRLHDRILERSGGSWWRPPAQVEITRRHRRNRDRILATIPGELIGVKDPRMLLLLDLWRELEPLPIGVVRNPVSVRDSLLRRAREQGEPPLSADGMEALWRHYNRELIAEHDRRPFPVVNFDRPEELDAQLRAALAEHGIEADGEASFVDSELARTQPWTAERAGEVGAETVELWEELLARALR